VGYWRWWAAELPHVFQVEFGGVQLWCPPATEGEPPCGVVALRFAQPISVVFLTLSDDLPDDWIQQFHDDELEPFDVSEERFSFNNDELPSSLLQEAIKVTQFHGAAVDTEDFREAKFRLCFAAESAGLIVAGNRMDLCTSQGLVPIEQVEEMSAKWWAYWKEYWKLKRSDNPLPRDYACEATIPLKASLD
jgi:hypothetical protein